MSESDAPDRPFLRDAAMAPPQHTLAEILDRLPADPGVYLMKDRRGKVIYVGKAASPREALRVVNRHFQLRTCTDHVLHNRRRPCLQYQIKRCPGPCVLPVARDEYADQVRDVRLFLEGKNDQLLERLRARMKEAA